MVLKYLREWGSAQLGVRTRAPESSRRKASGLQIRILGVGGEDLSLGASAVELHRKPRGRWLAALEPLSQWE